MRRSWLSRSLSAVLAVWLAFLVAEPLVGMHDCPMHDGVMAMERVGSMPQHGERGSAHAMSQAADKSQQSQDGQGRHQCTCVGDCTGSTAFALPSGRAGIVAPGETATTRDTGLPEYEYVAVWAQYILPFQNGPPRA